MSGGSPGRPGHQRGDELFARRSVSRTAGFFVPGTGARTPRPRRPGPAVVCAPRKPRAPTARPGARARTRRSKGRGPRRTRLSTEAAQHYGDDGVGVGFSPRTVTGGMGGRGRAAGVHPAPPESAATGPPAARRRPGDERVSEAGITGGESWGRQVTATAGKTPPASRVKGLRSRRTGPRGLARPSADGPDDGAAPDAT